MTSVAAQLVASAISFGGTRIRALANEHLGLAPLEIEDQAASVAGKLGTLLGVPANQIEPGLAAGHTVRTHLIAARGHLDELPGRLADLGASPTTANVRRALEAVVNALKELHEAVLALQGAGLLPASKSLTDLLKPLGAQLAGSGGVLTGLGLAGPPGSGPTFDAAKWEVSYELKGPASTIGGALALSLGSSSLFAVLRFQPDPAFALRLVLRDAKVSLAGGALMKMLGSGKAEAAATLDLVLDSATGLGVGASGRTSIALPPPPKLTDLLDVKDLRLNLVGGAQGGMAIELVSTISSKLAGVAQGVIEGVGVRAELRPGGALDAKLAPPTGMGLSVNAGLVKGGGFLSSRTQGGDMEFSGALELKLGPFGVKAAGILTIGHDGDFALVIVMAFEFTPAIDLSFGFTLNAVGGVFGINHVIDVDALRAGLRNGALEKIMFPKDPVASAPAIIATLGSVFPRRKGGVVIGPMVQVGWGRPISFMTASLGLILSVPDPKVVVIGRFRLAVPAPEAPIIDLRADVLGEFSAERVLIIVSLHDSRIALFSVFGDIGLLIRFGSSPDFALSSGGFHPRYKPPPELADLRRIGMDLSPPAVLKMRSESYVAVTSNSFQLGCHVEIGIDIEVASAEGFFTFDVIVRWSPSFSFEADLAAGITVRVAGFTIGSIRLAAHLSGPAPWRAHGRATVDLPWPIPDLAFGFGPVEWGDRHNPPPQPAHPRALVHKALEKPEAWLAQLGPGADTVVRLRAVGQTKHPLLHPLGRFEVRQQAAPLDRTITRIGPNPVPDRERLVSLTVPTVNGTAVQVRSPVDDLFPPGQFLDLTDDQRLSRPNFEPMPAGLRIDPAGTVGIPAKEARGRTLAYETFVVGVDGRAPVKTARSARGWNALDVKIALGASAAARSQLRASGRYAVDPVPISLADPSLTRVASATDLTTVGPVLPDSQARALVSEGLQLIRLGVA